MSMYASNLIENIMCGVRELFSLNLNFFCYLFEYYNKKIKERKDFISIWEKLKQNSEVILLKESVR